MPYNLSIDGHCFISGALKDYLRQNMIDHIRGAPYHPMTQGKIERYHRLMKNVVLPGNYYYTWKLEQAIAAFVEYYNHQRYHEVLDNLTPADVYFGRDKEVLSRRKQVKEKTLSERRELHFNAMRVYNVLQLIGNRVSLR